MLATFIIGLREGLEAALIVGIIAAFLRSNGKSLAPMWIGVALAVLLSVAVGVSLELAQHALPQAKQEALETIIGFVAVFFVTGMIVWMNNHAREMKRRLEADAAHALKQSSSLALASMAFLAVLKEGFETSVFLLATFSVAQSTTLAAAGALLGLIIAIAIGWGIYTGGVRFNLSRFFRYTTGFLILVAAGLVMASLRTAHEAGWIVAGQQATIDLTWLVAPGTIQSALVTGVLGLPADPRLVEVLGWLAYLIPVALYVYWPQSRRPQPRAAARLKTGLAVIAAAAAVTLAIAYPEPRLNLPDKATLASGPQTGTAQFTPMTDDKPATLALTVPGADSLTLTLPQSQRQAAHHQGQKATVWTIRKTTAPNGAPTTLTLTQVANLAGGQLPVGLNPQQHPGPFKAAWSMHRVTRVWATHGVLLDAVGRSAAIVTLSSDSLMTPRTFTIAANNPLPTTYHWQISSNHVDQVISALGRVAVTKTQRKLWAIHLPIVLAIIAAVLLLSATRTRLRLRRTLDDDNTDSTTPNGYQANKSKIEGAPYAAN